MGVTSRLLWPENQEVMNAIKRLIPDSKNANSMYFQQIKGVLDWLRPK